MTNTLYYGDNLDILRRYIPPASVDLVYLDPPFNSKATYNVLFAERDGSASSAQVQAFDDTWHWDSAAAAAYVEIVERGGKVADAMRAFRTMLGDNDMLAYLAMMAPRLVELHRVLKPTGSIYLHCDPTASHYLKILMDGVFGVRGFRNEIIWKRKTGRGDTGGSSHRFGNMIDILLFYAKSDNNSFYSIYRPNDPEYLEKFFSNVDENGRRYAADNLASPSPRPNLTYEYKGFPPPSKGWAVSRERMEEMDRAGLLIFPKSEKGRIRRKRYLDELPGEPVQNIWDDISPLSALHAERLGYPTQKPESLLERIIQASSNEGDVVLDPFCGCGTTVAVAQRLNRQWIGIDITHLAIMLMKHRLRDAFGDQAQYQVIGEPGDLFGARALAEQDRYQFQFWALGLVGARTADEKRGADHGIDGRLYFHADPKRTSQIIISVKSGHVNVGQLRDLCHVVEREGAEMGVFITLEEPTGPMRAEAAGAGVYTSPWGQHPRVQILTIEQLLAGARIDMPPAQGANVTFKRAERAKTAPGAKTIEMFDE